MRDFIKTNLNPSPMIRIDHLGELYVLKLKISYIEDNACFKIGGVILRDVPLFLNFSSNFNCPVISVFL